MNWIAKQIDWLVAWAKSKNITTHTVGGFIVAFAVAYNSSSDMRNYISTLFVGYPVVATKIAVLMTDIAAGVALWRNFSHSSSPAGTLATAREIHAQPDAPTSAQIDAASTK
jgi:hypothetical protein